MNMKKIVFCLMAVAAVMMTGCTKEKDTLVAGVVRYDYSSVDSLRYISGHTNCAVQFMASMSDAVGKYEGKENIDEKQLIADMKVVVNQYNNRYLWGTFDLKRKLGDKTTVIANFTLQTQNAYYVYDCKGVVGLEGALAEFQSSVGKAVALLDEMADAGTLNDEKVKQAMETVHATYNKTNISGKMVISYHEGTTDREVATYTFVATPIYRVRHFDSNHVNWVKGLEHCALRPFNKPIKQATTDEQARAIADSVHKAIDRTCYYTKKDSVFYLQKSIDGGATYNNMKPYTLARANYIIGMDSAQLYSAEYSLAADRMYNKMQDSMKYYFEQGWLYDDTRIKRVQTGLRDVAKEYKNMTGTITLFGLYKDDRQDTLATIDLSRLDDK